MGNPRIDQEEQSSITSNTVNELPQVVNEQPTKGRKCKNRKKKLGKELQKKII